MDGKVTPADVRALATEKGIPLSDAQIAHVAAAASVMRECAARVRAGLRRNDEQALAFRAPAASAAKDSD